MAANPEITREKEQENEAAAAEQARVDEAATKRPKPGARTGRDALSDKARKAEEARQKGVRDAVAAAGEDELPNIGGPMLEPGLGR